MSSLNLFPQDRPYLSPSEIEKSGLMTHATLYRVLASGELAHVKIGKTMRVPRTALDEFISSHAVKGGEH
jgi:excisionase family DNA binding protein